MWVLAPSAGNLLEDFHTGLKDGDQVNKILVEEVRISSFCKP